MKIALFHPWLKSRGGAERTVLEFLKYTRHNIDIYTWVYDKENTFDEFRRFKIKVSAPKIFKKFSRSYILRGLLFLPLSLLLKIPLKNYDAILISTGGLAEFISFRNYKPYKTCAYVHTILRAAYEEDVKWNLKHRYKNLFSKIVYLIAVCIYRFFERIAWKKINIAIFNSELSLKRAIKHNLLHGKQVAIVYPPVDLERFRKIKTKKDNFFIYPARFGKAKRQDVLLKAWKTFVEKYPNYKLVLVGNVENKKYFKEIEKLTKKIKNVEIKTNICDKELLSLYTNCLAVIFIPFMEDFGIVPFETAAVGKPLIAVDKGGYVTIIEKYYNENTIWIKEKENLEEKNIVKGLEEFLEKKLSGKKTLINELDAKNFAKKLDKILEDC